MTSVNPTRFTDPKEEYDRIRAQSLKVRDQANYFPPTNFGAN
jgi:hypothetical protein